MQANMLFSANIFSSQNWPGLTPQKFNFGNRKQIRVTDLLQDVIEAKELPILGRKHFQQHYSDTKEYRPQCKVFPLKSNRISEIENNLKSGLKYFEYCPNQGKQRPQKAHFFENASGCIDDINYGVKAFKQANRISEKEYFIENSLQKKKKIEGLLQIRNQLQVTSLGDKQYKTPEYQKDFFKQEGIISGSTNNDKRKKQECEKVLKSARVIGKLLWTEKQEKDEKNQNQEQFNEIDRWEETIFKAANPNWKDPEQFFQNQENGVVGKDIKLKDEKNKKKK